jgi:hypothetical protein
MVTFWLISTSAHDRQAVHAQARVYFEKVKDDLDVAQLGMQEFSKMCLEF